MTELPKPSDSKTLTERLDVNFALKAARLGVWELDPITNLVNWDAQCRELFGLAKDNLLPYEQAIRHIHPDDINQVDETVRWAMNPQSGGNYDLTYRTIGADDGLLRWVRFIGQGYFNEAGNVYRFAGIAQDVTKDVQAKQLAESEERFRTMAEGSGILIAVADETSKATYFNKAWVDLTGRSMDDLLDFGWADLVHPDDRQRYVDIYLSAFEKKEPFTGEFRLLNRDGDYRWLLATGPARFRADGSFAGYISSCVDITGNKLTEEALKASEYRFQAAVAAVQGILWTNNAKGEMEGEQPGWAALTGQSYEDYQGYGWSKAVHPDDAQATVEAWNEAVKQRRMYVFEHRVRVKTGQWELFSVRAIPLLTTDGSIREWVGVHTNITEQRQAEEDLKESEQFSRSIFNDSPIANLVCVGQDMTIRTINENMLEMLGRDASIIGKPFMEAIPELIPTPLMDRLRHVLATGETFYQPEEKIDLIRYGKPHSGYYNYIYKALYNAVGDRYGVICTATEVTELVLARQQVEETEVNLRGAIELADLGTWQIDLATGVLDYSNRLRAWFGIGPDEIITIERAYRPIREADRPRVREAIIHAITPDTDSIYDVEYQTDPAETGQKRILRAQGKAFFNAKGEAYKISGTVQDVTEQRQVQLALEQQVEQRTQQLQTSVQDLQRSNQNLQQFAYIASHDLQEPLRKIQSFGDLLSNQYGTQLGEGIDHLKRMQTAASRMSILIKDLLTFSRISIRQDATASVILSDVMQAVLIDLELVVKETGAIVTVDPLPTVWGDKSQLEQLFQNLLSNALKFRRVDQSGMVPPLVRVRSQTIHADDLPTWVRPTRVVAAYYRIDVTDNGIGFDEKYVDRIFQVFQRLHGRNEFAGTGIGLAICEKVAANHGGAITASSQLGQGATFSVYLPGSE